MAEEILQEIGKPEDFSSKKLSCFFNVKAMCCNTKIPDQMMIYNELLQNKRARHLQSIANFDEFNMEIKDLMRSKSI